MSPPLLELRDFSVARAGRVLVHGDSWSVRAGARILLTGPSGSGKSSFLLALAGLADGQALTLSGTVHGRPRLGMVFQNPFAQVVCPDVEAELAFGLENAGWELGAMRARVAELLTQFRLESLIGRAPWTLSGGEAQRLALASVVAPQPELVVLDEPLSYLDPAAARQFVNSLHTADRQTAWVVVDHDPEPWRHWAQAHYTLTDHGTWQAAPVPTSRLRPTRASGTVSEAPLVELRQLTAGYGRGPSVLRDFNLTVRQGETVALTGPSGVGKSTILRCLTGQLKLRQGRILVRGQVYRRRRPQAQPWIWVPQVPEHFFLFPTVAQELAGLEADAAAWGLAGLADRHPFSLSEGEKRRLNLVVALATGRPLILLDEPQYGLDATAQTALESAIQRLQTAGRSLIIISHDPDFCARVAHRVVEVGS